MSRRTRIAMFVGLFVLAVAAVITLPVDRMALSLVTWIQNAGIAGVLAYAIAYVVATLFMLPGSLLTLGAGFAYGPLLGTLLVSPVSVLAATLAFLLGRGLARSWIADRTARNPRFAAIDRAVGQSGFKIVALLRLSPVVPFNLLNYALGLTRVRLRHYVLASFAGMLPGTFLYVYLGSLVTSASELASGSRPHGGALQQILYWGGLVATLLVSVVITRVARRALERALEVRSSPPPHAKEA